MGMTRRQFNRTLAACAAAVVCGAWNIAERILPAGVVHAVRGRFFGGRVVPFDEEKTRRPAGWKG